MSSIPARATELSSAPSARDHLLLRDQGLRGPEAAYPWPPSVRHPVARPFDVIERTVRGIQRRWQRERRRRKVGRAYDMAQEIARMIPRGSEVLDVGCGNGFIAHHLSAMLGTSVVGIDLAKSAEAPIDYRRYDGAQFPVTDDSCDAVLLCYVLHHAQVVSVVLNEIRRVLRHGGRTIIYEDIPQTWWDKGVCWIHNQQWRDRTGPCTFRNESEWRALFESFGFEIVSERRLSRWRNLTHPVARRLYLLKRRGSLRDVNEESTSAGSLSPSPRSGRQNSSPGGRQIFIFLNRISVVGFCRPLRGLGLFLRCLIHGLTPVATILPPSTMAR